MSSHDDVAKRYSEEWKAPPTNAPRSSGFGGTCSEEWRDPALEAQAAVERARERSLYPRDMDDRGGTEVPRTPQIVFTQNMSGIVRQHAVILCSAASDVERQRALDALKQLAETDDGALSAVLQFQKMKDAGLFARKK